MRRSLASVVALAVCVAACNESPQSSLGSLTTGDAGGISADDGGGGVVSVSATGSTNDGDGTADADGGTDGDSGGGLKLDVGVSQFDIGSPPPTCEGVRCDCDAVDILVVVDAGPGATEQQTALAAAFGDVIDALVQTLPAATSLHVGVTTTAMGFSAGAATNTCGMTGDDGQPAEDFYESPLLSNNGLPGAQGRLRVAMGTPFFSVGTDASIGALDALDVWLGEALAIGADGSAIPMGAAAAGWAVEPDNDMASEGFVRDAGAVLAVLFVQLGPDQTPPDAVAALSSSFGQAKFECGVGSCVVGGGFVDTACLADSPLATMTEAWAETPLFDDLPLPADADAMQTLLQAWTEQVAATCVGLHG